MESSIAQAWKVFPPVYIVVGTIGNIFVISLVSRRSMREASGALVMVISSIIDILILYTSLMDKWMTYGLDRPPLPDLLCKLQYWFASSFGMAQPWFLVLMTTERTILVLRPLSSLGQTKSKSQELIKILIFVAFIILINSHIMYGLANGSNLDHYTPNRTKCYPSDSPYLPFFYNWVKFLSTSIFILPNIILFILDIAVLVRLGKCCYKGPAGSAQGPNSSAAGSASRSLNMILVMNFIYLVTTLPMALLMILQTYTPLNSVVSNALLYIRNAVGFLSYLANGKFRQELLSIYRRWCTFSKKRNEVNPVT